MAPDKYHLYGFRLGYNKNWQLGRSAKRQFSEFFLEDFKLKREVKNFLSGAGVSHVAVERTADSLTFIIYTSRPGIIIGRKGAEIGQLRADIAARTRREVHIFIQEIHNPVLDAQLQAEKIAALIEKRVAYRRAMHKTVEESLRLGAKGIKIKVSGRLNGAEMASSEWHLQGQLPLHSLRADIVYGLAEAHMTFGVIRVKVWIYRGENLDPNAAMTRGRQTGPPSESELIYVGQLRSIDDPYYDAANKRIVKTLKKQSVLGKTRIRSAVRAICESEPIPRAAGSRVRTLKQSKLTQNKAGYSSTPLSVGNND